MAKTEATLGEVHDSFANWCTSILQGVPLLNEDGKAVLKENGQPWLIPPTPAHMNVIRQFLKDNNIDCTPKKSNPLGVLQEASALPFGNNVTTFKRNSN